MRKLLVIFLFLVYGITQTSVLVWYYGKNVIHAVSAEWQSIRATVNNNATLSYLKLDTTTYRAKAKNDEISLNGTLYDITNASCCAKTVCLTLEKDEFETYLLLQFNQLANWIKKHHPSKQSEQYVFNWMMKLYFSCTCHIQANHFMVNLRTFAGDNKYFPSPYFEIPGKPPEQSIPSAY